MFPRRYSALHCTLSTHKRALDLQLNETNETHDDVALSGRRSRAIKIIDCWQSALLLGSKGFLSATMITKGWYGQKGVLRFYFVREYRVHVSSQSLVSYFQLDFEKKSRLSAVYKAEDTGRLGFSVHRDNS